MTAPAEPTDENLWLEAIHEADALAWVTAQSETTLQVHSTPAYDELTAAILDVLDSDERIPYVHKRGTHYYNFWRDAAHPRGLWRRTTLASYRSTSIDWQILLDIDKLGSDEATEWVFAGASVLWPDYRRALVRLSPDGGDAVTIREFDLTTLSFVENGFEIPAAKSQASWIDEDTIFVATDFGEGSMTSSSYPRTVRKLQRGQHLDDAELIHEVGTDDLSVGAVHDHTRGFERDIVFEQLDFFHGHALIVTDTGLVRIDVPEDADASVHREWLLVHPRSDWRVGNTRHSAGSLLAIPLRAFLAGGRELVPLFTPDDHTALESWDWTRNHLILTLLQDVASRLVVLTPPSEAAEAWTRAELPAVPTLSTVRVIDTDPDDSDEFWLQVTGFTTPTSVLRGVLAGANPESATVPELVKTAPSFFDESRFDVEQHWVSSADGTSVPYFQVARKGLTLDGSNPTLLSGYGGFQYSNVPEYSGVVGRGWLERGGVYVVANIRGGGEFGPTWHTAALKANRPRAYEDFVAVARDLVARRVTVPERLGCEGRSNGGLLVGNMLTKYPDDFGAVVCGVPLLDMQRYTHLSAGASWIAEYGDPDKPYEWEFIRTFSPYHLLQTGVRYPPVLFYAATSDDRVGPVQARKMAARMQAMGLPGVFFYENTDGGHGGAVDNSHTAKLQALVYEFLWNTLAA